MTNYFVVGDYSADHFVFSFEFVGSGIFLTMLGVGILVKRRLDRKPNGLK